MPRQADLAALGSLIEQAYMVVSSDPMPPVARENLKSSAGAGEVAGAGKQATG
jgi:hypothetical protein